MDVASTASGDNVPLRIAPFRGQSPGFCALAPVRGLGRQLMPVQLPVLTAQTNVFSSAGAVAVFSTLVAIAAPFLVLKVSPIHAGSAHASSSVRLQAGEADSCSRGPSAAHKHQRCAKHLKTVAAVLSATPARASARLQQWRHPNQRARASGRAA